MGLSLMNLSSIFEINLVAAYSNMVPNNDFENWSGGVPTSWSEYSGINAVQETTIVRSGSSSAALITSGNLGTSFYPPSWAAGTYRVGLWVYDNGPGSLYIRFRGRDTGTNTYYGYNPTSSSVNINNWQFLTTTLSVALSIEEVNIQIMTTVSGGNPLYVDSCYITDTASFVWIPPAITHPGDIIYQQGQSISPISWTPTDTSPTTYTITRNGTEIVPATSWTSGSPISTNIDGLLAGTYYYTITATNSNGISISDTVIVTVTPPIPPSIVPLSDMTYQEGLTGYWLNWTASDDNPTTYTIYEDDSPVVLDATWSSGVSINHNIDGFSVGTYNYTIVMSDGDGLSATDTVIVTVVPTEYIVIDGDADLAAQASSEGWLGDGSAGNPYRIENYSLGIGGNVAGISIGNTSSHFIISNVTVSNYAIGFYLNNVTNGLLTGNDATNNEAGFWIEDCWFITCDENNATNSESSGFEVYTSNYCSFTGNNATGNTRSGIYVENSIGTTVELNNLSFNGEYGISTTSFAAPGIYIDNDIISNNIISNSIHGIYLWKTINNTVKSNAVYENTLDGINLDESYGCKVFENDIHDNVANGIKLSGSNSTTGYDNLIQDNLQYGISADSTSYLNSFYRNGLYRNNGGGIQGYDDGTGNTWYDTTTSEGNLWYDWSGIGTYQVDGGANTDDLFPQPFIILNGPVNFSVPYGSSSYSITWTVFVTYPGNSPDNYTVYQNEIVIAFGSTGYGNWSNTISVSLAGLDEGLYNYTVEVFNNHGMTSIDTVWITVEVDTYPPVISSPSNISFEEGSIGYSITWSASDMSPWQAVVLYNSTPIYNESWIGENITIHLDDVFLNGTKLTIGVHNFTCILYDKEGNWANDTVFVTVEIRVPDTTPPTITTPDPLEYVLGTVDHYLTWNVSDDHPMAYQWFINDTDSGYHPLNDTYRGYYPWHGENITLSVDYLPLGLWVVTVTVFDLSGNNATANVTVSVIPIPPDFTPPSISQPAPLEIYENRPGSIVWEVSDDYPSLYVIYQESTTIIKQGYWTTGIIQYTFLSLPVGTWEFNLTVWDKSGNWNSNVVTVTILSGSESESIAPQIAQVPDMTVQFGTTGNTVIFRVFDEHPGYIEVVLENSLIYHSPWFEPDQEVMVSLDGLVIGTYNLTLIARDLFGNSAARSITVQVIGDTTPPTLSSPDSISTSSDSTATITWTASDNNLARYEIYIVEADEQLDTGTLVGQTTATIQYVISGFDEGEYTIRLIVYDASDHRTMDDVLVEVGPAIVEPAPGFELVALIPVLLVCVIARRTIRNKAKKNQTRRSTHES
ncbi:MAG: NosD domain-containing protein [Candidatus Hodarchaeales archaeon]|jgi:parallel beta-helix repeat protein